MILSLCTLALLVPVLLGSRPGECKNEVGNTAKDECTEDEDCTDLKKKCCPTRSGGKACRIPAQTCSQLDCGPKATCIPGFLPFCDDCSPNPCRNGGTCTDHCKSYTCTCPPGFTGNTCNDMCALTNPGPCEKPFETETAAGGWTVFQRRCNGCVLFNRTMAEYVTGFGNPEQEFWLGLDNLHAMTSQQTCELRVDLQLFNGKKGFAVYSNFLVGPSSESYTLTFDAKTSGDLNDWLQYHNGKPFTTDGFCAESLNSGWWFYTVEYCGVFPLNSPYSTDAVCYDGLCPFWLGFENYSPYDSIKTVELRFRPMRP